MTLLIDWDVDEAVAAIRGLGEIAGREVQVVALKAVAKPLAEEMQARFRADHPTGTGRTAADIRVSESAESKGGDGLPEVLIGGSRRKGGRAFIIRFVERGTIRQAAKPFMRPTYAAARAGLPKAYAGAIRPAYLRILKKYSKVSA